MWKMCAMGFKWACRSMGKKRKNSFHFVNKLWYSDNAGCAISQKKNTGHIDRPMGELLSRTHTHTLTHVAKAAWKKCQGIKSTCAFAMSCEIHRTHQRNNNNSITTTTTMEQQQQQRPHNGHRLSFCWKWATATSFAIGGIFLYSHILQHSAMQGTREREWGIRAGEGGACLFAFF